MKNLGDIFNECKKSVADLIDRTWNTAYKQGKADAVKLLFPFVECSQEPICEEVMDLTAYGDGNTWCKEHCNNFCEECVMKWLELKQ